MAAPREHFHHGVRGETEREPRRYAVRQRDEHDDEERREPLGEILKLDVFEILHHQCARDDDDGRDSRLWNVGEQRNEDECEQEQCAADECRQPAPPSFDNARRTLCGSDGRARSEHRGQHRRQGRGAERIAELCRIGQQSFEQADGLKDEDHRHREDREPERNGQHGGEVLCKEQCTVLTEPRHINLNCIGLNQTERIGNDRHDEDGDEKSALHPPLVKQQA